MLKFLVFLFLAILIFPRLLRLLAVGGRSSSRRSDPPPPPPPPPSTPDSLQDLTRQDITDAEFEDIPPED